MFHVKHRERIPFRYNRLMDTNATSLPIKQYAREDLVALMEAYGQPGYRADQIIQWLYQRGATSYDQMTDLPKALRQRLADNNPLYTPHVVDKQVSRDGTRKFLLSFEDGCLVETVGIPSSDGRLTVCFSTQVGCAMGCIFCATGYEGFTRNLSVGEIIDQITIVQKDFSKRVTNLVGMGQGEPFLNYDSVLGALAIINSKKGLGIGARKITLSTCGIIKGIQRFSEVKEQYTLAISLHAARQSVRDRIMPHASSQPLNALRKSLVDYLSATNRRITFEYTLMKGINDSKDDLQALLSFASGLLCHINLIQLNEIPGSPFHPSSPQTRDHWQHSIENSGIECTVRVSKGADISGACGQLKNARA